jgi:hypothetical protein
MLALKLLTTDLLKTTTMVLFQGGDFLGTEELRSFATVETLNVGCVGWWLFVILRPSLSQPHFDLSTFQREHQSIV